MDQTRFVQRVRMNQFERVYQRWEEKKLTQAEAAAQLGVTERTFRRYTVRYRNEGMQGLLDRRLGAVSHNRASSRESSEVVALYKGLYPDRNVVHFYEAYTERHGGRRCYNWTSCVFSSKNFMYIANSFFFNSFLFFPLPISCQPDLFYAASRKGFLNSLSNSSLFSSRARKTPKRRSHTVRTDLQYLWPFFRSSSYLALLTGSFFTAPPPRT